MSATWSFADCLKEGESKSWANPRISTISVHDGPILRKKLSSTLRLEHFLLDVRRFSRQAAEDRKTRKSRAFPTWHYGEALVRVPAMNGWTAAKPAPIEKKCQRGRRWVRRRPLDAPRIGMRSTIERKGDRCREGAHPNARQGRPRTGGAPPAIVKIASRSRHKKTPPSTGSLGPRNYSRHITPRPPSLRRLPTAGTAPRIAKPL